ncbi:glycosyltransferase family 4 protein [Phosphitispora fastidiosa]|uniref:glycosyltransferase family 4 protein n=1 Tax=Phosphitispora fastidiosa TaxID=2837202 RepID=UPI001E4ADF9C|nr:glycosyltransferase family 4 protein [Phosphitispora fastidiosa]MBU7008167.1 glycosyltransferase involved in cell wall biosynthesis [Phosphitispora fastidiosa]
MNKSITEKAKHIVLRGIFKTGMALRPILDKILPKLLKNKLGSLNSWIIKTTFSSRNFKVNNNIDKNLRAGINLIGYVRAEMGIGESCRVAAKAIETTGIPFGIVNVSVGNPARMNDLSWRHREIASPLYNTNLIVINAEQIPIVYTHLGPSKFDGCYNIGYWAWELPDFPNEWCNSFNMVQEVWVPSKFVLESVSLKSPVPVIRIPHAIEVTYPHNINRSFFGLPDNQFLFLAMFDTHSTQARKNPEAVIEAFRFAFSKNGGSVGLVLKINNSKSCPEEIDKIKELIKGYSNIYLIDEIFSREIANALMNAVDCFVSLHRAEGFGLIMAEAMYLGKPVIGTNWSGNTDFMDSTNSCMVEYKIINVGNDFGPYKSYQVWADPDIEQAAKYMLRLVSDQEWREKIAKKGQENIHKNFSPKVVGQMIQNRLKRLGLLN